MKPVKLAIVGCGIAARDLHWPALKLLGRKLDIAAVCSRTLEGARSYGELVGCRDGSDDYDALLARKDIEAVDLVLPIHLNFEFAQKAIRAGKHVIVEKPIAASVREAEALCRLAAKSPVVTMVAENFRYRPTLQRLKKMIDRGDIGDVYSARYDVFISVTQKNNKYAKTSWRVDHKYPAGFPVDGGIHNVNALRFLFGELKVVRSSSHQINPGIGDIDTMRIEYESTSGTPSDLYLYYSANGMREIRLLVFGTKGSLEMRMNTITWRRDAKDPKVIEVKDTGGYVEQFEAFYSAIRNGRETITSFEEGTRDLKAILGAVEMAQRGSKKQKPRRG